jgi:hypothetical protein
VLVSEAYTQACGRWEADLVAPLDGGVVVTSGTDLVARALVVLHWSSVVVVVWSWYCL